MKRLRYFLLLLPLLLVAGCGSSSFKLEGLVVGRPNANIRVVYADATGGFVHTNLMSDERGRFEMTGDAPTDAIVEIYAPGEGLIGLLVAKNGDKLQVRIDPASNTIEARGNKASQELALWLTENHGLLSSFDYEGINKSVLGFVESNPDSKASAAMLLTLFHAGGNEEKVDSLSRLMIERGVLTDGMKPYIVALQHQIGTGVSRNYGELKYRSLKDSVEQFVISRRRVNVIAFEMQPADVNRDSLMSLWRADANKRLGMFEVSLTPDSALWKRMFKEDSARWDRGWMPGMVASPSFAGILPPRVPYYVVVDSMGTTLYRGDDIKAASRAVRARWK